jgi:hypothetical protein
MQTKIFRLSISCLFIACTNNNSQSIISNKGLQLASVYLKANNKIPTIGEIPLPQGYYRNNFPEASFCYWLRQQKLKKDKTVYLYNGSKKENQTAQFAVLDIPVGNKNLQQCADAVMRLRAEYLFDENKFDSIRFIDNDQTVYQFEKPYTKAHFLLYLNKVFAFCGTASLASQLIPKNLTAIQPGDVFIRGGFPGHAVIVMDVAENIAGNRIFLLAQSYMPAQDIHLLKNPSNVSFSPWYIVSEAEKICTPEYVFTKKELKGWQAY